MAELTKEELLEELTKVDQVGEARAKLLLVGGFPTIELLAMSKPEELEKIKGVSLDTAALIIEDAVGILLEELTDLDQVDAAIAKLLYDGGFTTIEKLSVSKPEELEKLDGVTLDTAALIIKDAVDIIEIEKDLAKNPPGSENSIPKKDDIVAKKKFDAKVKYVLGATVKGLEIGETYTEKQFEEKCEGLFEKLMKMAALRRAGK